MSSCRSTSSTSTAINSSSSNSFLIAHGLKSLDISLDREMQQSLPVEIIQNNHPIQSLNNDNNRSFSHDNSTSSRTVSDPKSLSHSTINSSSKVNGKHQPSLTLLTRTPAASTLHLIPVEPHDSPSCLELLHRLCVGPENVSMGDPAVGNVNGESGTGGGREGEGNRDSRSGKEKEFGSDVRSERETEIGTEEGDKVQSQITNCDVEKSYRRVDGQILEGHDGIYSDTQFSPYRPVRQSDCDLSQKIGFTKQLEFIHKLTSLVENLRFIDRLLRTESLCAGLAKINESPEDLGVWIAVLPFACMCLFVCPCVGVSVCLCVCVCVCVCVFVCQSMI